MVKLSIIIPVYNSEKYLDKCLESVCHQNLSENEYEIILINDGSVDRSKEMIAQFAVKYSHIVFINQENQGVSVARNAGLAIAKGDYITFIDSDDSIYPGSLRNILSYIFENDLDILYGKIEHVDELGNHLSFFPDIGAQDVIKKGVHHDRRTYPPTFYRKLLIKDIKFNKEISIGEDTVFNAMAQSLAEKVGYFAAPYYLYTHRENSLSTSENYRKKTIDIYLASKTLQDFQHEYFPKATSVETRYFDEVQKIFFKRIIEWGVYRNLTKEEFMKLSQFAVENGRRNLLRELSKEYKMVDRSFIWFYISQKLQIIKQIVNKKLGI